MLENRHLKYFLEVANLLHVTKAAERLHIAQPALTQNMQQLESELGVQLFHRAGRRLTLTEAGRVFRVEAETSLRQFSHAQRAAQRAARGELGTLVLGFQSTAGLAVVPQLVQCFRSAYPEVEIVLSELGTVAQNRALLAGEIDVGLMYTTLSGEFAYRELIPESLVIALPEDHRLASRDSIALKDLADETLILPSPTISEVLYHAVLAECADSAFQPKKLQEVATAQTALGLVSAHFGVAVLPGSVRMLARKGVEFRPIRNSRIQVQLALMWPKENASPIIPNLIKCIPA